MLDFEDSTVVNKEHKVISPSEAAYWASIYNEDKGA